MTKQLPHPGADQITLTGVLAALSDPIRLAIVATLARTGERGWSEFDLPVCKSTLSHHVKVLREAGIIQHRKDGTRCWITLRDELEREVPGLLGTVLALAEKQADLGSPIGMMTAP
jgi:DNA-binding transcriptional ArsR family regulator